jgi:AcrR family transcriptional regulator
MEATPGLRERKKLRTREAIVKAAFELFAERGFEGTTIAQIAEVAEIAPRTFFSYFPSKDDVVFHDFEEQYALVSSWLSDREPGANTFDALRAGIAASLDEGGEEGAARLAEKRLRNTLVRENESLAAHSEHLRGKFATLVSESVAADLGAAPSDLGPRLVAAAMMAAMNVVDESEEDAAEHSKATFESLLAFLQGGLAALQDQGRA